jgi:hypothetical protein
MTSCSCLSTQVLCHGEFRECGGKAPYTLELSNVSQIHTLSTLRFIKRSPTTYWIVYTRQVPGCSTRDDEEKQTLFSDQQITAALLCEL